MKCTITALVAGLVLGATGIATAASTGLIHFHNGGIGKITGTRAV